MSNCETCAIRPSSSSLLLAVALHVRSIIHCVCLCAHAFTHVFCLTSATRNRDQSTWNIVFVFCRQAVLQMDTSSLSTQARYSGAAIIAVSCRPFAGNRIPTCPSTQFQKEYEGVGCCRATSSSGLVGKSRRYLLLRLISLIVFAIFVFWHNPTLMKTS